MDEPLDLRGSAMVAVMRESLGTLRAALFRGVGADAAGFLQEAGFAGGAALHDGFARWLTARQRPAPDALSPEAFERAASEYFRDLGWGDAQLDARDNVLVIESANWAEADPQKPLEFPGCHVSSGMFADFFGRIAGNQLAVMEVECRSAGASRCRFLLGSSEVIQYVYSELERGADCEAALHGA